MGAEPSGLGTAASETRRIRVLVAKVGLDGHDVGARVVARGLVDEGMEVVYTGVRRTPEQVVAAASDEDVDVIGVSILSGAHVPLLRRLHDLLEARGMEDVCVIAGGIIPDGDIALLRELGVEAVFHPGSSIADIAAWIRRRLNWPGA